MSRKSQVARLGTASCDLLLQLQSSRAISNFLFNSKETKEIDIYIYIYKEGKSRKKKSSKRIKPGLGSGTRLTLFFIVGVKSRVRLRKSFFFQVVLTDTGPGTLFAVSC